MESPTAIPIKRVNLLYFIDVDRIGRGLRQSHALIQVQAAGTSALPPRADIAMFAMGSRSHGNRNLRFSVHGVIAVRGNYHSTSRITIKTKMPSRRRGFITKLAHSGISSKVIMKLAGHKHASAT